MIANRELLETADIIPAVVPVDFHTATNPGLWVSLKDFHRCMIFATFIGGTSTDYPVISLLQATSNAGAGSKALPFLRYRLKQGATFSQTVGTQFAITTLTVPQTTALTLPTPTDTNQVIFALEVIADQLDVTNGFNFLSLSVAEAADSRLATVHYIPYDSRHPQAVLNSAMA